MKFLTTMMCALFVLLDGEFEQPWFALLFCFMVDFFGLTLLRGFIFTVYILCALFAILAWLQCLL